MNLAAGLHDFHAFQSASDYPHITVLVYSSILFEAISNALQHSRATELRVEAGEADGGVRVRVIDNGVGFDVASSWERSLLTMKSRAERIGAQLDIQSAAGGTTVEVVIPREPATG